jgi:hypothetical protein
LGDRAYILPRPMVSARLPSQARSRCRAVSRRLPLSRVPPEPVCLACV